MAQVPATRTNAGGRLTARREHPLQQVRRDFDNLFGRLLGGWVTPFDEDFGEMRVWDFDVTDTDKEIVIRAEMPGFEENEIDVQMSNNVVTIRGEKQQKGDRQEEYRTFYRSITLPPVINPDKAQATYRNGVLELHLPKAEEAQPRRVQVQRQQEANGQGQQTQANQPAGSPVPQQGQRPSAGQPETASAAKAAK